MIGRLKGIIAATGEGQALIDVSGVGYLVHAGSRTLGKLTIGEAAELFVETQMSESAIRLFAFVSGEERAWFARLQDAPGVGAKIALAILDTLTLPRSTLAVLKPVLAPGSPAQAASSRVIRVADARAATRSVIEADFIMGTRKALDQGSRALKRS